MQVRVDDTLCTACEVCVDTCPDVFEMGDEDVVTVKVDTVPEEFEDDVQESAESCPCEAILIDE